MTLLEQVSRSFDAAAIPHAVIGAAALAARGVARSTYDIDLLTTDSRVLSPDVWAPLQSSEVVVDIRRGDADDPLAGVVGVTERPARGVALVLARDLVLLKLYAGGTQDLWDVRALLDLPDAGSLASDVDQDLASLPADMRERWTLVCRRSRSANPAGCQPARISLGSWKLGVGSRELRSSGPRGRRAPPGWS
jgi:hypothetical protein